jgi:hypothetical protein
MLIKSSDFSLEFNLIGVHLLRVRLKSIYFIGNRLFISFGFLNDNKEFLVSQLVLFALDILIFVSFKQLSLTVFVLLVLTFEISEFTIKFVQIVFFLLNGSMSLIN